MFQVGMAIILHQILVVLFTEHKCPIPEPLPSHHGQNIILRNEKTLLEHLHRKKVEKSLKKLITV